MDTNPPKSKSSLRRGNFLRKYVPPHKAKSRNPSKEVQGTTAFDSSVNLDAEEREKARKRLARFSKPKTPPKPEYGLLSRGDDTRLRDNERDRLEFYSRILYRFIHFCSNNTPGSLQDSLTRLLSEDEFKTADSLEMLDENNNEEVTMDSILMSLRKLREALLRNAPSPFHKKVFMFSVRISTLFGHYQTYVPSINYLIRHKDALGLSEQEFEEVVTILILHLVHVNEDVSHAINLYFKYIPQRWEILKIIQSWIHKNYCQWIKIYNEERNDSVLSMMRLGYDKMVLNLISGVNCLYYTLPKADLEESFLPHELKFEDLSTKYDVGWRLDDDGQTVIIRERRKRTTV